MVNRSGQHEQASQQLPNGRAVIFAKRKLSITALYGYVTFWGANVTSQQRPPLHIFKRSGLVGNTPAWLAAYD